MAILKEHSDMKKNIFGKYFGLAGRVGDGSVYLLVLGCLTGWTYGVCSDAWEGLSFTVLFSIV